MPFAFFFPGQGSQSLNMMSGFDGVSAVRDTFAEASDAVGQDLWVMMNGEDAELIGQTVNTQPLMLAAGVATYRAYLAAGGKTPDVAAGHSLGEYTALVAAGSLHFADAVRLVRRRAELMQSAVPQGVGAMAAVLGLDDDVVRQVCAAAEQGEVCEAVNFNSVGQVVIAGNTAAVERAMQAAKEAGAKRALPLPVSVPSHCRLMHSQCRCGRACRTRTNQRRIGAPTVFARALDGNRAAAGARRHHPIRRMRAGQSIGRFGKTHRQRSSLHCAGVAKQRGRIYRRTRAVNRLHLQNPIIRTTL